VLNQISTADGQARVQKFNNIDIFSTCTAFLHSITPTAVPFFTVFPLLRTYTLVNPMQIESYLDEVNEKCRDYAWIN
jgi:hypothetical protein